MRSDKGQDLTIHLAGRKRGKPASEIQPQLSRRQRNQQQNLSFLRVTRVKPAFLNGVSPRRRLLPKPSPTSTVRVKSRTRVKAQVMLPSMYFMFYSM